MNKEKCKEKVIPNDRWGAFHPHQCTKPVWKDGYCKIHHPETVKARAEKSEKRYEEKWNNTPYMQLINLSRKVNPLVDYILDHQLDPHFCESDYWLEIVSMAKNIKER